MCDAELVGFDTQNSFETHYTPNTVTVLISRSFEKLVITFDFFAIQLGIGDMSCLRTELDVCIGFRMYIDHQDLAPLIEIESLSSSQRSY